ncbi:MAG: DEAD/DEAH box helicase family protein [Treponema sp.]|nr:DEAD/DEAH box helicase family protein [Treponema sp.]
MARNEAQTRFELIDPAILHRGWTREHIKVEQSTGGIFINDKGKAVRRKGRTDYLLRLLVSKDTQPHAVALLEAKAEDKSAGHGLEQGKRDGDCDRLNVNYIFSSNGHQFVEYDKFSGLISKPKPMSEFPTPDELKQRYEKYMGFLLESENAKPLLVKYANGENQRRYYQDAAIRAVFEKTAQGKNRALLSLATGAGKTFIAVNLLKRIDTAGQLKKALFICDRDELRTQANNAFMSLFGTNAAAVENRNPQKNAKVIIATYQSLGIANDDDNDDDSSFLLENYPENYFSHIIIDECHRSAWGKWSLILKRNEKAIQIGLTATPRNLIVNEKTDETKRDDEITADNIKYFGEPVYEYDMLQAVEDGYLAACEILKSNVDIDDTGITLEEIMKHNPHDAITGQPITTINELKEYYKRTDYESKLMLPDRISVMCKDLFDRMLKKGTVEQKTIIFCVRDIHSERVANEMNNLYNNWCKINNKKPCAHFAFKCTAQSCGSNYIADMKGSKTDYFIATTVDLLSTGVDIPAVRNIVFFRYVTSPISFHQMVGRGTRLAENKLMFTIYDYTNATRLFGNKFVSKPPRQSEGSNGEGEDVRIIQIDGIDVEVTSEGRYLITEVDGNIKRVSVDEYKKGLASKIVSNISSFDDFLKKWINPIERQQMLDDLIRGGYSVETIRQVEALNDYDLYDIIINIAYDKTAMKRNERIFDFQHKQRNWLSSLPQETKDVIIAIVDQFAFQGTDSIENDQLFKVHSVIKAGGIKALSKGGDAKKLLDEAKLRLFAA